MKTGRTIIAAVGTAALAASLRNCTLARRGRRAGQLGRQKMPVLRTAKTKRPS